MVVERTGMAENESGGETIEDNFDKAIQVEREILENRKSKIASLNKKLKQTEAQLSDIDARLTGERRKADTRAKIILGAGAIAGLNSTDKKTRVKTYRAMLVLSKQLTPKDQKRYVELMAVAGRKDTIKNVYNEYQEDIKLKKEANSSKKND